MYLVVPLLKNRQIEIEHGYFLAIGGRLRDFSKLSTKLKKPARFFGADPPTKETEIENIYKNYLLI